jgi:hypothetical protein
MSELIEDETNKEIIDEIRDIYRKAKPEEIRFLIEKHFIPTQDEKKKNAEIPTPVKLVDEMLDKMPVEFWTEVNSVFEPCCGKGNFVLGIFDRFFNGLTKLYPDDEERCRVIIVKCLYYADLTRLNVFITTELLKCHIESKVGKVFDIEFNSNVGDTLKLDVEKKWGLKEFDAVIGNPPYNKTLFKKFSYYGIKNTNSILLFVIPSNFTINITGKKFIEELKLNGLKYLNFLNREAFNNKVNIDTLYFLCIKNYKDDINVNDIIQSRTQEIINTSNSIEQSIFNKILKKESFTLLKGKNETLNYKNQKETDNIKLNRDDIYCNKLLSRLNGGRGKEFFWVKDYKKEESNKFKIVFPRGTASYNSISNLKNINKDMVYCELVDNKTILSSGLMYIELEDQKNFEVIKNFLMRHKLIRFIFLKQNKYSELTKGLFKYIPKIPTNIIYIDEIYKYLEFTNEEILYIENIFNVKEPKIEKEDIKPVIKKTNTDTYTCFCGSILKKSGKTKHEKSKKHNSFKTF